jgi:HEAT repeats
MAHGLNDPDPKKRLQAALMLAQAGDFSGIDTIVSALANEDGEVRIKAAFYCQRIGCAAAIAPLTRMATSDSLSDNRNQAIYALVGIGRPAGVPAIIAALDDAEPERRDDARTALYRLFGKPVLPVLTDEVDEGGRDEEERAGVAAWWQAQSARFDPELVYFMGKPASPGVFIHELKTTKTLLPDAILGALGDWTGQDFGQAPRSKVTAKWEKWWAADRSHYEAGRRYYYGHRVP